MAHVLKEARHISGLSFADRELEDVSSLPPGSMRASVD